MDASSMKEKSTNTHKRPYEGGFINGEQILSSYCFFNISLQARVAEHNSYPIFNNVLRKHFKSFVQPLRELQRALDKQKIQSIQAGIDIWEVSSLLLGVTNVIIPNIIYSRSLRRTNYRVHKVILDGHNTKLCTQKLYNLQKRRVFNSCFLRTIWSGVLPFLTINH